MTEGNAMNKNNRDSCKTCSFWPRGRGWIPAALLAAVVAASLGYATQQYAANRDAMRATATAMAASGTARTQPDFNLERTAIPKNEILSGGPPKDGIPALTGPEYVPAGGADFMNGADRVAGVSFAGQHRAYPLKILDFHEAVNDRLGDVRYCVTYCPLCDSVTVFNRELGDGTIVEFGVSGRLYNSNVLLYDRRGNPSSESLWSQMRGAAVTGESMGAELETLPYSLTTWSEWKASHPDTLVLSNRTGFHRNYDGGAYAEYFKRDDLWFPVSHFDKRLPPKTRVLGVKIGETARAYPVDSIRENGGRIADSIEGTEFTVSVPEGTGDAVIEPFPDNAKVIHSLWFAWAAFHPGTEIHGQP